MKTTSEYSALLMSDEESCALGCGCVMNRPTGDDSEVAITFCHLHENAEKVRAVLGRLHDGLSDMLESGRLTEGQIPDDYQWLVSILVNESLPLFGQGERVKPADVSGAAVAPSGVALAVEDADGDLIDSLATALGEVHEDEIEHDHYGDGEDCSTCAALRAAEVRTGSKYINDPGAGE